MRAGRATSGVAAVAVLLAAAGCGDDDEDLSANAGDDFSVEVGVAPTFDGCDSNGNIVNYAWTIVSTPSNMAEDVGKALREQDENCSFTLEAAMIVDEVGEWTIELEVTDGDGATSTDTVVVDVTG